VQARCRPGSDALVLLIRDDIECFRARLEQLQPPSAEAHDALQARFRGF
jgi:hypothetical protein